MYYAVDASSNMVRAFRTRSYRAGYVISHCEGKVITSSEARVIMADYIGELKAMYGMRLLCERYDCRCRFDGCVLGIVR